MLKRQLSTVACPRRGSRRTSCAIASRRSASISTGASIGRISMRGVTRTTSRSRGKRMPKRQGCEGTVGPDIQHGPTSRGKKRFVQTTYAAGPELVDITHALAIADELEDQERLRKMKTRRAG